MGSGGPWSRSSGQHWAEQRLPGRSSQARGPRGRRTPNRKPCAGCGEGAGARRQLTHKAGPTAGAGGPSGHRMGLWPLLTDTGPILHGPHGARLLESYRGSLDAHVSEPQYAWDTLGASQTRRTALLNVWVLPGSQEHPDCRTDPGTATQSSTAIGTSLGSCTVLGSGSVYWSHRRKWTAVWAPLPHLDHLAEYRVLGRQRRKLPPPRTPGAAGRQAAAGQAASGDNSRGSPRGTASSRPQS